MQVKTRADWGALPPKSQREIDIKGPTTLHWNGPGMKWKNVAEDKREQWIKSRLQIGQRFHMLTKGWSDIAYSFAADPWGMALWELRGLDIRPASQGTSVGNNTSHSIYVLTGLGDGPVTDEALAVIDQAAEWIAEHGTADHKLVGHRDWKSTTCPGDYIYSKLPALNRDEYEPQDEPVKEPPLEMKFGTPVAMFRLGNGYGVVDENGKVETKNTPHLGDLRSVSLGAPIVDAEGTHTGKGYILVGADGGVFCFGDATYRGSVPEALNGASLAHPIISIEVEKEGYYMVAADGGLFAFGNLPFEGSFTDIVRPPR